MKFLSNAKRLVPPVPTGPSQRPWLARIAVGLIALLALIYYYANGSFEGFIPGVASNVIATLIVFAAVYFVLERRGIFLSATQTPMGLLLRAEFRPHDRLNWKEIIRSARTLDIVVFYYGSWIREHYDEFVLFFRKGGSLRLIVSDPEDDELMEAARKYFFPKLSTADLKAKVLATFDALRAAATEAGNPEAVVNAFSFSNLLHYSYVLKDDQELYFSAYEQFRSPTVRSHVFKVLFTDDEEVANYWRETGRAMLASSKLTPIYQGVS